jgi:hypothetical protein
MNHDNFSDSGWEKRNVAEEPRLSELVELYNELGFEVVVKECSSDDFPDDGCKECIDSFAGRYKVIYTRQKSENDLL